MCKTEKVQNCVMDLGSCVQKAGGVVDSKLLSMTLTQFIEDVAAPNNITFSLREENEDSKVS